jgi:riboflavin kinase/FMN adenylyltransferase
VTQIVRYSQSSKPSGDDAASQTLASHLQGGVVSIGNFDGVHLGHRALLGNVQRIASELQAPTIVVVFDPHPAAILRPDFIPERLTWIERRAELLSELGIDCLLVIETTPEFLSLSAEAFFDALIVQQFKARAIVEGPNFFFGRDRQGNVDTLAELCQRNQIDFTIAEPTSDITQPASDSTQPATQNAQLISSTRIRNLLKDAKLAQANEFLGTPYRIRGNVVKGQQRGRTIGFPTANLSDIEVVIPSQGVYGGYANVNDTRYRAAIHVGPNPTFEEMGDKVEVHLLDFSGDLYGQTITVDFITAVRDIAKFDSADELVGQLHQDVTTIRRSI